ncbi:hypothetical protein DFH11DRAFT_1508701 [Phellopilus nigrolimitatus]|nr:hypothetical protein DFH11DRAFT_1508701 [Phellopilus nigrolimitatus]
MPPLDEMHTAQIDSDGTQFAYIDSGAPQSDTYTTVVCVHGYTFNALNFSRLLPLAHKHDLRIIAPNRRDYAGSTPFSDIELDVLNGKDDHAHMDFLQKRGLEIARFLVWIISEKKIPQSNGTSGGLALLGWSLGNVTTLSFLAHLGSYPQEIIATLEPYLRTFCLYDIQNTYLGYPSPEGAYSPFSDPEIPQDMVDAAFAKWISSYYAHPAYSDISAGGTSPGCSIETLQDRTPGNPYRSCTTDTLTAEELFLVTDLAPAARSEQKMVWNIQLPTFHDQARRALLFRDNEYLLPELNICSVYGLASEWDVQWAVWELEKDYTRWRAEGIRVRPVKFMPVEGGNHFVSSEVAYLSQQCTSLTSFQIHWDDADKFLKMLRDVVGA